MQYVRNVHLAKGQAYSQDSPIISSERTLHKDYYRKDSLDKKNLRSWVSRGLTENEPIGVKPPVSAEDDWDNSVAGYSPDRTDLSAGSWKICTVNVRYQETAVEDTEGWRRISVCSNDLWSVEIGDGAVITCNYEWCV
jgi:hypothetical protein